MKRLPQYTKYKKGLGVVLGVILIFVIAYLAVFGRALSQKENHIGIVFALPKVILGSGVARIDDKTYLSKNSISFVQVMEKQGFTYTEQLGAGYFFEKDGNSYLSIGKMYSSHFMVFTYPTKN